MTEHNTLKAVWRFFTRQLNAPSACFLCDVCGGRYYHHWRALGKSLWRRVGLRNGMSLCPDCFEDAADTQGISLHWMVKDVNEDVDEECDHEWEQVTKEPYTHMAACHKCGAVTDLERSRVVL
jgi:hypothetical protein